MLVRDAAGAAMTSANVSATFTGYLNVSCVTVTSGRCSVTRPGIPMSTGSVTLSVNPVTRSGLAYDLSVNRAPDSDNNDTSIIVLEPRARSPARARLAPPQALREEVLGRAPP